jgi:AcrR family transcriptional regulator
VNSDGRSRTTRTYNNAFREEQARQTREKILETAVALLREGSEDGLSVPGIAERSGISVATVYRHFPDRDALFDALQAWMGAKLGRPPVPETIEELVDGAPALFRYYENAGDLMRLVHDNPALRELNERRRRGRDRQIAAIAGKITGDLDPRRANAVGALIRTFYGFEAYRTMRDRFGVEPHEASEIVAWAAKTLIREIGKERAGASGTKTRTTNSSGSGGKKQREGR